MPDPFVDTANLRPGSGLSVPFPPQSFVARVTKYADGTDHSKVFPGQHEKEVTRLRRQFTGDLNGMNGANADTMATNLAQHLETAMQKVYKSTKDSREDGLGKKADPESQRVMQGAMVVQALLNSNPQLDTPKGREIMAKALGQLTEQSRVALLRADDGCGKKLYSAVYQAKKENVNLVPQFTTVKSTSQTASVFKQMDQLDPTGQTSQVLRNFQQHLQTQGVSTQEQKVFMDKLAFKMTIKPGQGQNPDIPTPNTANAGWQDDMTAAFARTFAEAGVTDDSVTRMLNMDVNAKARLLGHAASGSREDATHVHGFRREGDFRIMKEIQRQGRQAVPNSDADKLGKMAAGLEKGSLDRNLALQQAKAGTSLANMNTALQQERQQYENTLAGRLNTRVQKIHDGVGRQILNMEHNARVLDPNVGNKGNPPPGYKATNDNLARVNRGLGDLRAYAQEFPNAPVISNDQAKGLLERFGRGPLETITATNDVQTSNESLGFANMMNQARQLNMHVEALGDTDKLKAGLDKLVMATPTAGRRLQDCAWVDSTARDLVETARAIKRNDPTFSLANHPIIIFDQTDGDGNNVARMNKFNDNAQYLRDLELEYQDVGLKFVHVGMQDVHAMTQGSGIEKLFDTTGETMAGYGGGRNITYLLGPVVKNAYLNGTAPDQIQPGQIKDLIAEHSMSEGAPKVFMGDDTDYVSPGMIANIATLAQSPQFEDQYSLHSPLRGGRDTQSVAPLDANEGYRSLQTHGPDAMVSRLFACNKWSDMNRRPGMGCTFGSPRFCLDLPTGKEETHNDSTQAVPNFFGQAFHRSGDRQASLSDQLKANMSYTNLTAMVGKTWNNSSLPWNVQAKAKISSGDPMQSLGEVMEVAADQGLQKEFAKEFFNKLVDWRNDPGKNDGIRPLEDPLYTHVVSDYIQAHPELDPETVDELTKVQAVYTDGHNQAVLVNKLIDRTIANLKQQPGNNGLDPKHKDFKLDNLGTCLQQARTSLENEGAVISQGSNKMVRDVFLVINTVGAGSFQGLANQLHGAQQNLNVNQQVGQVQDQNVVVLGGGGGQVHVQVPVLNQIPPIQVPNLGGDDDSSLEVDDTLKPTLELDDDSHSQDIDIEKDDLSVEEVLHGQDHPSRKEETFGKVSMTDRIRDWEKRTATVENTPKVEKQVKSDGPKVKEMAQVKSPQKKPTDGTTTNKTHL